MAKNDSGANQSSNDLTAPSKAAKQDSSTRLSRTDVASWISGPRGPLEDAGIDIGYRGQQLGLPESGVGSVTGFGRRAGALFIDWICCALVAQLMFPQYTYGSGRSAINTLLVFFVVKSLFTWLGGATPGQRILGIRVISLDGNIIQPWWALLRTLMVCLVVPAVVWNRDGRGLQDLICRTVVVRSR